METDKDMTLDGGQAMEEVFRHLSNVYLSFGHKIEKEPDEFTTLEYGDGLGISARMALTHLHTLRRNGHVVGRKVKGSWLWKMVEENKKA